MANSIFAITPASINKVLGQGAWNDGVELVCHMVDGISDRKSQMAKDKFVELLESIGIKLVAKKKIGVANTVEIFNASGKTMTTLTEEEKRKAISIAIFKTDAQAIMFAAFAGEQLDIMYNTNVKKAKDGDPVQLYRVILGDGTDKEKQHILYRVTSDLEDCVSLVSRGIRQVIERDGANAEDFPIEQLDPIDVPLDEISTVETPIDQEPQLTDQSAPTTDPEPTETPTDAPIDPPATLVAEPTQTPTESEKTSPKRTKKDDQPTLIAA